MKKNQESVREKLSKYIDWPNPKKQTKQQPLDPFCVFDIDWYIKWNKKSNMQRKKIFVGTCTKQNVKWTK